MTTYVRNSIIASVLATVLTCACQVSAQGLPVDTEIESAGAAYFQFLRSGEVPIEVLVMGDVGAPGIYSVGVGTGIAELLALSRGGNRDAIVRLYQQNGDQRLLVYEQPVQQVMTGVPVLPPLASDNILFVEVEDRSVWFTLDNVLRLVTTAATLLLVYDRFRN